MTVSVFLDTNIIMSDYNLIGRKLSDLLNAYEELNENESLKILLTEMNYHEVIKNFKKDLNPVIKANKESQRDLLRLFPEFEETNYKNLREEILTDYVRRLDETFIIYSPSSIAYEKAIRRYYEFKMPFRENKEEFKDAIIWETIFEYSQKNSEDLIYFISNNYKDFANKDEQKYKFHPDYNDLNGRIKFINSVNEFLEEIQFLKVHHFDFREKEEILNLISGYLENKLDGHPSLENAFHDYFSNNVFQYDFFEGWGTDYYLNKVNEVNFNEDEKIYETEEFFYIPIEVFGEVSYSVEMNNPVYEPGDESFIQSDTIESEIYITLTVIYNIKEDWVESLEDFTIELI